MNWKRYITRKKVIDIVKRTQKVYASLRTDGCRFVSSSLGSLPNIEKGICLTKQISTFQPNLVNALNPTFPHQSHRSQRKLKTRIYSSLFRCSHTATHTRPHTHTATHTHTEPHIYIYLIDFELS